MPLNRLDVRDESTCDLLRRLFKLACKLECNGDGQFPKRCLLWLFNRNRIFNLKLQA